MNQSAGVDFQQRPLVLLELLDERVAAADAPFLILQARAAAGLDIAVLPAGDQDGQVGLGPAFEERAVDLDWVEFLRFFGLWFARAGGEQQGPGGQGYHYDCGQTGESRTRGMLFHFISVGNVRQ